MLHVLILTLVCLFQTIGCDSTDNSGPDIVGKWTGSVELPNSPFFIVVQYTLNITDNSVQGTGTFVMEERRIFRTTEIEIEGSFDYTVIHLEFRSEEDRVDVFAGVMQESGNTIIGVMDFPSMALPELSPRGGVANALGGESDITFTRQPE